MPSALVRFESPANSLRPMRRTSPPSTCPGNSTRASLRNLASACAIEAASGRRVSVPSGKIIANSSRTIAGSSTNSESGSAGLRRKRNDARAALFEKRLVGVMLLLGLGKLDALPDNMGQLAINYAGTDGARNGGEHGRKVYMKMFRVRRAAHTLERADKMSIRGGTA